MFKRVLSAILIFSVLFAVLPVNIAFAEESQTTEISNQYIKIVVNNKNGGYVISTLEGDILKKSDNNVSLTHRGENYDTSFTSFTIWEHNSLALSPTLLDLSKRSFAFPISFLNPVLYMKVIL